MEAAPRFIKSFSDSAVDQTELSKIPTTSGLSLGEGGIVELTEQVNNALGDFVRRAAKLLGSAAAHENAISQTAMKEAQSSLAKSIPLDIAVKGLIAAVFAQGNTTHDYLAPNKLIMLAPDVKELSIGRVRAMRTLDLSLERKINYPCSRVQVV